MFSRKKDLVALSLTYPYNEDVVDNGFALRLEEQLSLSQINEILITARNLLIVKTFPEEVEYTIPLKAYDDHPDFVSFYCRWATAILPPPTITIEVLTEIRRIV
jgi:hypothetical protein